MDKKTATLTLTERLRDNNSCHVIINPYYQKKLLEESVACYQIGEIVAFGSYVIRDSIKNKNSALYEKLEPKANYLFIESFEIDKRAIASSFAIVGEEEVNQLRNTFYKDIPHDVEIAMKVLDIKNYSEIYEKYSNGELNKQLLEEYPLYIKLKESLRDLFKNRHNNPCPTQRFNEYLSTVTDDVNKKLKGMNIDYKVYGWSDAYVHQSYVEDTISVLENTTILQQKNLLPGFFNLAFIIPIEEQNIEANKTILKLSFETLDYVKILVDEYFSGRNFQEYFACLDAEKQKKVINTLEFKKANNPVYNSFLWSKGFKTVGLDHLRLYKDDAKGFIEYFTSKNIEEKKAILKDVMSCEFTNEEVVNWLNENQLDLVREVGLE